jgi:hypothetical protein
MMVVVVVDGNVRIRQDSGRKSREGRDRKQRLYEQAHTESESGE